MIHFHGLPITPDTAAVSALSGGHAFVSFANPRQLGIAAEVCQSFALDNGAFPAWKSGNPIADWRPRGSAAARAVTSRAPPSIRCCSRRSRSAC